MTCNDCLHWNVCKYKDEKVSLGITVKEITHNCKDFKNKADYAEVKHGEWIPYPSDAYVKCSVCGMEYVKEKMPNIVGYCPNPNCGAKMDGVKNV